MQQPASQPKPIPPRSDPTCSLRSSANCVQDCTGPGAPVVIEVALGANIAGLPEGSDTRARFQVSLMRDLSTILKVSGERVLYLPRGRVRVCLTAPPPPPPPVHTLGLFTKAAVRVRRRFNWSLHHAQTHASS
jgi:hypothetical protein